MNHSTVIGGALIFTFLLFLASRNRLTTYAAVLWGSPQSAPTPARHANATAAATPSVTPSQSAAPAATTPDTVAPAAPAATSAATKSATPSNGIAQLTAAFGSNVQTYASSLNQAAQLAAPLGLLGF